MYVEQKKVYKDKRKNISVKIRGEFQQTCHEIFVEKCYYDDHCNSTNEIAE